MLTLLRHIIDSGQVPSQFRIAPATFGTEVELRWKRYHNSATDYIRVFYNPPSEEVEKCRDMLAAFGWQSVVVHAT